MIAAQAKAVTTRAELRRLLQRIQQESGKSIRAIAEDNRHAPGQQGLSKTTISRVLNGDEKITRSFVERFATACDVSGTDHDDLVLAWKRVLDVPSEEIPDPAHLVTLEVMAEVASTLDGHTGGLTAARRLYERVRAARDEILGPEDPLTLEAAHNLGTVLAQLDEYRVARRILCDTYEARSRVHGPDAPATLATLENLAAATAETGDMDAAVDLFEQALAARRPETSPGHARYPEAAEKLLVALNRAGRQTRARQVAEELARVRDTRPGPGAEPGR